jgi:AhpD family alkylhydroperoxidase
MEQRIDLQQVSPEGFRAVFGLERHVRSAVKPELLWIVKLRASVVNGCAHCVDMHGIHAIEAGEDVRRVLAVSAWRESTFFSPAERAALALTDAVTRLGDEGVTDDVWQAVVDELGQDLVVELLIAIATINVWNRLAVPTRKAPPPLEAPAP